MVVWVPSVQVHLGHTRPARSALDKQRHVCARTYVPTSFEIPSDGWLECSLCHVLVCNTHCSYSHALQCSAARRPPLGCRPCVVLRPPTNRSPDDSVESVSSEPADREDLGFASPMDMDEGSPLVSPVEEGASPAVEEAPRLLLPGRFSLFSS